MRKAVARGAANNGPRGSILFVSGPTDSGKSQHMWDRYTCYAPRILTVEVVEETAAREDGTREIFRVYGYEDTRDALRAAAEINRWHVIASLDREEIDRLFYLLCPPLVSATTMGYAKAVGGMVLGCGELAHVAPIGLGKNSIIKTAYLQHRHHWLTIHGAAQHPADCDPCTRMYAKRIVALLTQDKLGLGAIENATSKYVAELVAHLPEFHSATCVKKEGRVYLADEKYRVYDVKGYRDAALSPLSEGTARSSAVGTTAETNGRYSRSRLVETH
jgi:hypothetical protein